MPNAKPVLEPGTTLRRSGSTPLASQNTVELRTLLSSDVWCSRRRTFPRRKAQRRSEPIASAGGGGGRSSHGADAPPATAPEH